MLVTTALVCCGASAALATSTDFKQPTSSPEPAGDTPYHVAAADFDGDGDQDLAVTNHLSNTVRILVNSGSGNFSERRTSPEGFDSDGVPVLYQPSATVADDLDGDGDIDLAVANVRIGEVTILLNRGNGDFAFAGWSDRVGRSFYAIAGADFDGDGDVDLAVTDYSNHRVPILINDGSGAFTPRSTSPERPHRYPVGVEAADLDGDGDPDLAIANHASDDVTVLRNTGGGDFKEVTSSPEPVGNGPSDLTSADLDGDGDLDLAVVDQLSDRLTVLVNTGRGGFRERSTSPEQVGDLPTSVTAADFDGDGDTDLAVTSYLADDVTILANNGAGNFTTPSTSPEPVGEAPSWITGADLDGDGDTDLAVSNWASDDVTILRNFG